MRKLYVLVVIGTLLGCGKGAGGGEGQPGGAGGAPKMPVEVQTLQEESLSDGAEYLAQLVSRHQVAIYPQVTGVVVQILAKPGDQVKQGAALIQIDPRREAANLANQVAAKEQREASLELAKRNEERATRLFREGLVSQAQFDQARSSRVVAEADVNAQAASIAAQSSQLNFFRIVAPFNGTLGDIPVKLGDMVSSNMKLTSIADNKNLEAYVNLPVERLGELGDKSRIEILDPAGKVLGQAPVNFIAPETNPAVQSVLIKAVIPNESGVLRAAQVARARVVFKTQPGVRVLASTIIRQVGQYFVFVVENADGGAVVRQRPVELGGLDDNRYTVIKGLKAGDKIATTQLQKLQDGAPVDPKESASTASSKQ
ncbi:efflux RND transporter periplasmic adaptor subunit [Pendulispora albinea]|uniref:Efflux RND transporter periplasmic adaptor subunit n=1 Tax=Pendulispora albinea TaxID=2741071 RepID=A0ABZ2LSN6_9BACT